MSSIFYNGLLGGVVFAGENRREGRKSVRHQREQRAGRGLLGTKQARGITILWKVLSIRELKSRLHNFSLSEFFLKKGLAVIVLIV